MMLTHRIVHLLIVNALLLPLLSCSEDQVTRKGEGVDAQQREREIEQKGLVESANKASQVRRVSVSISAHKYIKGLDKARVYINGSDTGKTQQSEFLLKPGETEIAIVGEHYSGREDVLIPAGVANHSVYINVLRIPKGYRLIKGGCFMLGSPPQVELANRHYEPYLRLCVDDFYISATEVTNKEYVRFLNDTLKYGKRVERDWLASRDGKRHPKSNYSLIVEQDNGYSVLKGYESLPISSVSWLGARAYARWMTGNYEKLDGLKFEFRLPTDAQWEYSVRAGSTTEYFWGDDPNHKQICQYANINNDYAMCSDGYPSYKLAPVGSYKPNSFGLYDMIGNAPEWTCTSELANLKNLTDDVQYLARQINSCNDAFYTRSGSRNEPRYIRSGVTTPEQSRSGFKRSWNPTMTEGGLRLVRTL